MKDKPINSNDKSQPEIPIQHKALFEVLNNLDVYVVVLDKNGNIILFNKAAQQLTGYSPDNLKGKTIWSKFTPSEEAGKIKTLFTELKNTKSIEPMERIWKDKAGEEHLIRWSANVLLDDANEPEYIIGTGIDFTIQKKCENTLRNNEEFLNNIFSSIQDGVSVLDNDYNILKVNQAMEKWYQHAMPLNGKKCYQVYHGRTAPCEVCPTRTTLKTNQPAFEVVPKTGPNGKIVGWQGLYTFPFIDKVTGKRTGVIEYVRDITKEKEAESAIQEAFKFLELVMNGVPEPILVINKDYHVKMMNKTARSFISENTDPNRVLFCYDILHKEHQPCYKSKPGLCPLEITGKTGKITSVVHEHLMPDGQVKHIELMASPIFDNKGNFMGIIESSRDITDRKLAEEALKESEERYRTIIETANDLIWTLDIQGNFTFFNRQAEVITGHKFEDWQGKSFFPLLYPDDVNPVNEVFKQVLTGETQQYTVRIYNRSGALLTLSVNIAPIYQKGTVIGTVSFGRDITARKLMETALHQSEKRYRTLAEAAQDMIYIVDLNGTVQYVNTFAATTLHKNQAELVGQKLEKLFPPETSRRFKSNIQTVFDSGEPLYVRAKTTYPNGELWLGSWLAPIKNTAKKVTAVMGISRDITSQEQTENALHESEEKYRNLVENIQDGIFVIQDEKIQFANDAFIKATGYPAEEVIGASFTKFIAPEDVAMVSERYTKRQSGETTPKEYEFNILQKDGRTKLTVNLTVGLITYKNRVATMGTVKDITARKRTEFELKQSFDRLHKTLKGIVDTLSSLAEKRDPYTAGHQYNTARLAEAIAKKMNLPEEKIECIRVAGMLHDIGKISVPAEILRKPGKLTETEMNIIKIHPQSGFEILQNIEFPWPVALVIHQHHERMNGSGYPLGISGEDILIESRILGVADVVESMALERPYRSVIGLDAALDEITKNKGLLYDSDAVDACVRLFREKGFKLG
ncbi:MAG: PAS domain S-box protein [Candidatus Brocadiia bacterium]